MLFDSEMLSKAHFMHTDVRFFYVAPFVAAQEDEAIFGVAGAGWFVDLLKRIPNLTVNEDLCQEDWGVIVFMQRNGKKFTVGIAPCFDRSEENEWWSQFSHAPLAWIQRASRSGNDELAKLITDFHAVLTQESAIKDIAWYDKFQQGPGAASPQ